MTTTLIAMLIKQGNRFKAAINWLPFFRGFDESIGVMINDAISIQQNVALRGIYMRLDGLLAVTTDPIR